jgi:signal transduction histidine kinase
LDLLNYGKYSDVNFTEGDANAPAVEVIQLLASRAQAQGVTLRADLSDQLAPVWFDPEGIHRCLLNLVTNAIDACGEDDARAKTVTVKTQKPENWAVEYQVIDTGSGMTKDVQNKIFQSFFSTKGTHGTGIGLMMTKRIIDQHQGIIEVTSEKAAGSTIRIKLPFH